MRAFTAAKIRRLEAATIAREGADLLMQRAAAGLAASAAELLVSRRGGVYGARVLVLVGPGNNGGDALFAGARLARRGAAVTVLPCLGEPHPAGLADLLAAGGAVVALGDQRLLPDCDLALDGILGIGGRPGLPEHLIRVAWMLDRPGVAVLAVDLPSGIAADTGAVPGVAIRATRTVTFGARKPCHLLEPARSRCGEIIVVDIGLGGGESADLVSITRDELAAAWPYPDAQSDKYSRGVVGVDAGSDQYPGAGLMATYGAVFGGAGMVRFLGDERPAKLIEAQLPNVVFSPGRVQSHLFGSGWGERADGADVLEQALDTGLPTVVDADGLRHLPARLLDNWLLTPHAGELATLLDEERSWVTDDPVRAVRAGVEKTGATVLLKGASQLVASPGEDPVRVALPGPAWTAQAGSGDVLGGVCAALLAAGRPAAEAGQLGASLQALAATELPGVVPPAELARAMGHTLGRLQSEAREHGAAR